MKNIYRIPIGKCPKCNHSIVYSKDPKQKNEVRIVIANENSVGKMVLCSKCKTMLQIDILLKKENGRVIVPIYKLND